MFEKVNPSHPDKIADRIAGAIVDLAYLKAKNPKVAVEVLLGHGHCKCFIESSLSFEYYEINQIVERICDKVKLELISTKQDSHLAQNQEKLRCGDNGIFKGSPITKEQQLLANISLDIYQKYPFDGKYIIKENTSTHQYDVTICQSHLLDSNKLEIENYLRDKDIYGKIIINPLGEWLGGIDVDCGATNRKLGSDMGDGITGGGLHGKDLSKSDVSVNIWCFLQAKKQCKDVLTSCSIGDEFVNGIPYEMIVNEAKQYIDSIGGFEKFAEWGLIR